MAARYPTMTLLNSSRTQAKFSTQTSGRVSIVDSPYKNILLETFSRNGLKTSNQNQQILKGDANGDGKVNAKDAELMQLYIIGLKSNINFQNSDVNGNGKITMADVCAVELAVQDKEANITKLSGDLNGDGTIDDRDYKSLQSYFDDSYCAEDFIRKNADVNGDGEITKADMQSLQNILDENKQLAERERGTGLLGDINGDGKVDIVNDAVGLQLYLDGYCQRKDIYYGNADVNGDGKIDSTDIDEIKRIVMPPPPPYPTWEATAARNLPVYTDENLMVRIGNEEVWENDKVTVLNENDRAYFIRYPVKNGYKERWVDKSIFEPIQPPSESDTLPELQDLINHWNGKTWKDYSYLPDVKQCKEFASYIFYKLTGIKYPGSGSTSSNYYNWRLSNLNPKVYQVAEVPQSVGLTATNAKALFENAKSGDFIQMKRGHGGAHSAILSRKNDEGVWFFEANADGKNTIQEKFYSWNDLVKITSKGKRYNVAMSIYRAK